MSEQRNDRQPSMSDVFWLIFISIVLLLVTSMLDSCHAGWRYRDLRDRLERLEQKQ